MTFDTLVVSTLNLKWSLTRSQARADFRKVMNRTRPDLVGLQEMHREHFIDGARFGRMSYLHIGNDNPVIWRSDRFSLLYCENMRISKTPFYRPGSRKKVFVDATYVILFDHQTGKRIYWLNTHTPSNVQNMRNKRRLKVLRECMLAIRAWATSRPKYAQVIVTGDFNWDSAKDGPIHAPEFRLNPILKSNWDILGESTGKKPGTYKTRDIDYVFVNVGQNTETYFLMQKIITNLYTDHNGLSVTLKVDHG